MFPIVPYNLQAKLLPHCPTNVASFITGAAELLVPGKVTSSTSLPQGILSAGIDPKTLLGKLDNLHLSVGISKGLLELEEKSRKLLCRDMHWIRALRIADDCHSCNTLLRLHPAHGKEHFKLVLEVIRPINEGQELLLWFSDDLLALLQIGFLLPAHIQGQKKYVCLNCASRYESPNPLKLHMALSCGRHPITALWERLSNSFLDNRSNQNFFDFKLTINETQLSQQISAIDLSKSGTSNDLNQEIFRPFSESSAFKPFKRVENELETVNPELSTLSPVWPLTALQIEQFNNNGDQAQMETLMSSLGKSKTGHICLYCGKCYSRKYGLKIHIRTHTGYKPLKCQYCSRPFGDPSNLNKHVRLHAEGNTPYKCDLCGKILVRRRDLDRHLKSRHMTEMHPDLVTPQEDFDELLVKDESAS